MKSIGNLLYFHQRNQAVLISLNHTGTHPPSGRILVAPLDWGLGHATRCIPIIRILQNKGFQVMLAAQGPVASLLKTEFPGIMILPLPGYQIRYSRKPRLLLPGLIFQLPSVYMTWRKSSRLMKKWVKEYDISTVISDNRPELSNCGTFTIYITHQLSLSTGKKIIDGVTSSIHRYFINRFRHCWVPDEAGSNNLAGKLSHPKKLPSIPVSYLGCLSRFSMQDGLHERYDLLILLSGPEPQRTMLENILLEQMSGSKMKLALVRGLPEGSDKKIERPEIDVFDHLPSPELQKLILTSAMTIARCGYSTVMDLATLKRKAILVPTPGQGEQEYLAQWLKNRGIFYTVVQKEINVDRDLKAAAAFPFRLQDLKGPDESLILQCLSDAGLKNAG